MAYANIISHNIAAIRAARREAAPLHAARIAAIKERNYKMIVARNISEFFVALAQFAAAEVAKQPKKRAWIGRQSLVNACQSMDLDTVLFSADRRSANNPGHAVQVALSRFISTTFGQYYHATRAGAAQVANPAWFRQLYADLAFAKSDITPGAILQALS